MRKIFLALLLSLTSLFCSAQITRNIWGLELGKSTKQQVLNVLKLKGFNPTTDDATSTISVKSDNFKYGGGFWTYASFEFYNGRLYEVWFQNNEYEIPIAIFEQFNLIRDRLDKKYSQYRHTETEENSENQRDYFDGKTRFWLNRRYYNSVGYISITYSDDKLLNQKLESEKDEL